MTFHWIVIKDFRGQEWRFVRVSRRPSPGLDGKVVVKDEFDRQREFYWTVFPDVDFTTILQPSGD